EVYASADCFAFPSGTETFGNVVLEAMASRLPVVGVNSGGVTDFLSHDQNALLCAPEDALNYTNNLISIMEDSGLRDRLAENAYKTALSKNWNSIFDGLVDVYIDVIEGYRRHTSQRIAGDFIPRGRQKHVKKRFNPFNALLASVLSFVLGGFLNLQ
ncbi:MAG: glycosyltransferase, partial [Treponema sp.]|nr:glycosyltransferase [Treponema sp.]